MKNLLKLFLISMVLFSVLFTHSFAGGKKRDGTEEKEDVMEEAEPVTVSVVFHEGELPVPQHCTG